MSTTIVQNGRENTKDSKRAPTALLYGAFLEKLEPDTRLEYVVSKNRGITPSDHRSSMVCPTRASVRAAYQHVEGEFEETELAASGLHQRDTDGRLYRSPQMLRARTLFVTVEGGKVLQVRPHRTTLKGARALAFGWHSLRPSTDAVYVVEGEFKAIVLHELGYQAISSPGIQALCGARFGDFYDGLRRARVKKVVVVFDNADHEAEYLDGGRENPKYKDSAQKRYSEPYWAIRLGWRLQERGVDVAYARLGDELRCDGEADIDGVALEFGRQALRSAVSTHLDEQAYLEAHPAKARDELARRLRYGELVFREGDRASVAFPGGCLGLRNQGKEGNRAERIVVKLRVGSVVKYEDAAVRSDLSKRRKLAEQVQRQLPETAGVSVQDLVSKFAQQLEERRAAARETTHDDPSYQPVRGKAIHASETEIYELTECEDAPPRRDLLSNLRIRLLAKVQVGSEGWYEVSVGDIPGRCQVPLKVVSNTPKVLEILRAHAGAMLDLVEKKVTTMLVALVAIDEPPAHVFPGHIGWDRRSGRFNMPSVFVGADGSIHERDGAFFIKNSGEEGQTCDVRELKSEGDARAFVGLDFALPPESVPERAGLVVRFVDAIIAAFGLRMSLLLLGAAALAVAARLPGATRSDIREGSVFAGLWIVARSGVGKTQLFKAVMSLFGYPGPIVDGSASVTALNDLGAKFRDVLFAVDDLNASKTPSFEKTATDLVQRHGDHAERPRGTATGGTRRPRLVRGLLLANGEDDVPGGEAPNARALVVEHLGEQGGSEAYKELLGVMESGPQVGALLVSFIRSRFSPDNLRERINTLNDEWLERVCLDGNRERIAHGLAQYHLGIQLFTEFATAHGAAAIAGDWASKMKTWLRELKVAQEVRMGSRSVGVEFLLKLAELHVSCDGVVVLPMACNDGDSGRRKICGVFNGTEILVLSSAALTRMELELGWQPSLKAGAIARELATKGILVPDPRVRGRLTQRRSFGGKQTRCWVLDPVKVAEHCDLRPVETTESPVAGVEVVSAPGGVSVSSNEELKSHG